MTLKYLTEPVRYSEAAAALLVTGTGCRWLHRNFRALPGTQSPVELCGATRGTD